MEETENTGSYIENCTDFLKYNISVDLPTFSDEEYEAHLRSNDWSREETDYLFEVVRDYSYRWAVVWDRYDYQPGNNSHLAQDTANGDDANALAALPFAPPKQRSVEDLKARFYDISAKLMKLRIPEMQMDADQYSTYEILSKFDPVLERNRKTLASALMNRSMDEVKEEEFLLAELQRINMAANRLDAEREELRARLDAPSPNQQISAGLQSFTSSQALQALFSQLFQQDRSKKRASAGGSNPARLSLNTNDLAQAPASAVPGSISAANRRQSMALPQSAATTTAQTPIRTLPPHQELRFNVSTHDRLTSGVTFGSDKLLKMRQAKSNVQTQKIAAALQELGVPDLIPIPTSRVGEAFEALIGKVGKLLDVRKVREKEEGEIRVLEAMKEAKGGGSNSNNNNNNTNNNNADSKRSASTSAAPEGANKTAPTAPSSTTTTTTKRDEVPDSQAATPDESRNASGTTSRDPETNGGDDDDDDGEGDDDEEEGAPPETDADADLDDEDADAEGEEESRQPSRRTTPGGAGLKRSASVLSQSSQVSGTSKRLRK